MSWIVWKTVTHPQMKDPVVDTLEIKASSVCSVVKKLKISSKLAIELKRTMRASWTDDRGGTVELVIQRKEH